MVAWGQYKWRPGVVILIAIDIDVAAGAHVGKVGVRLL